MLVCDEKGSLSIAGVMGGLESEVTEKTRNVLLEGAAWNFINIRRTAFGHNLHSEASFRFSRGVHPALAEPGVQRGLEYMAAWSGGKGRSRAWWTNIPCRPKIPIVEVTPQDVRRLLGIELSAQEIADLLSRIEFECKVEGEKVIAQTPPIRMDIGEGVVGLADVLEEVARLYGYDNIPETRMADELPPQVGNPVNEWEEHLRDQLVNLGLQEVVSYRMTYPEREARLGHHRRVCPRCQSHRARKERVAPQPALVRAGCARAQCPSARGAGAVRDRSHLRAQRRMNYPTKSPSWPSQ